MASEALRLAVLSAATRLVALKAVGPPELVESVRLEAQLRDDLYQYHGRGAELAAAAGARAARGGHPVEAILDAVAATFKDAFVRRASAAVREAAPEFYRLAKVAAWRRATGQSRRALRVQPLPPPPRVAKAGPGIEVAFTQVDDKAMEALTRRAVYWIGPYYDEHLAGRIAAVTREVVVNRGLGGVAAGRELEAALLAEFGAAPDDALRGAGVEVPEGWTGRASVYWQGVASNTATVGRVAGTVQAFEEADVDMMVWMNPDDERSCSRCSALDGTTWPVSAARAQVDKEMAATDPEDVKRIHPWLGGGVHRDLWERTGGKLPGGGWRPGQREAFVLAGVAAPPLHFLCRCVLDME